MIKIESIFNWAQNRDLEIIKSSNYNAKNEIKRAWNIKESNQNDISFINKSYIDNYAAVVFSTNKNNISPNNQLFIVCSNPKLTLAECVNDLFDMVPKCKIHKGKNVKIGENCSIGNDGFGFVKRENGELLKFPHFGDIIIEEDVEIANNVCIDRGSLSNTIIRKGAKIDNLVHIAHNVEIGENTMVIAGSVICGSVKIGNNCWIAPNASLKDWIKVGNNVVVGLGAVVINDVDDNDTVIGNPAKKLVR